MRQSHKTLAIWVLLIAAVLLVWQFVDQKEQPKEQPGFSKFLADVETGNIKNGEGRVDRPRGRRHLQRKAH